jgi:ABC-2 type transport system permease protein
MHNVNKFLQRYRYSLILLRELVITDFKLRYQSSFLGYLWSLLKPLALFAILYLVFVRYLPVGGDIPHLPVYLLLGIVLWNYFTEVTNNGVSSIVGKGDLLRKINFPKYVIVLAGSFSALINLAINFLVVIAFMVFTGVPLLGTVWLVPLVIIELFIFALGMAFLLSALFVKLRDINYIWEVLMQGAFYGTPIIYNIDIIPHKIQQIIIMNPVAQMIQDIRYLMITHDTSTIGTIYGNEWVRAIPVAMVVAIALFSGWYFRKRSRYFAEEI